MEIGQEDIKKYKNWEVIIMKETGVGCLKVKREAGMNRKELKKRRLHGEERESGKTINAKENCFIFLGMMNIYTHK